MWNKTHQRPWLACALAIAIVGVARLGTGLFAQARPTVPASRGAGVVEAKCVRCHQVDMIGQQRLTRAGWQRELNKMIQWGAPVTDSERDDVLEYLATNFAPAASITAQLAPNARGAEVFRRSCLGCHQADMVEQQRLGQAAWAREVDKMVRWGAAVNADDKDALVDYFVTRFGPR